MLNFFYFERIQSITLYVNQTLEDLFRCTLGLDFFRELSMICVLESVQLKLCQLRICLFYWHFSASVRLYECFHK